MKNIFLMTLNLVALGCSTELIACDLMDRPAYTRTCHNLGKADEPLPFTLSSGFSGAEITHRWTDGNNAKITIPVQQKLGRVCGIVFKDTTMLDAQTVKVRLNNDEATAKTYVYKNSLPQRIVVELPNNLNGDAEISFEMPNAHKPLNGDPRDLGLSLKTVTVLYDSQFQLGNAADSFPFTLTSGFSVPEITHRWTQGKQAKLTLPINQPFGKKVRAIRFKDTSALDNQKVTVFLNNESIKSYVFDANKRTHTIIVPIPSTLNDDAEILFDMPDAHIPSNGDLRELGLAFQTVEVLFNMNGNGLNGHRSGKYPYGPNQVPQHGLNHGPHHGQHLHHCGHRGRGGHGHHGQNGHCHKWKK